MPTLSIKDIYVTAHKKPILHGVSLTVRQGETHVIMGPNGSGKSTLANTLLAHPHYTVTKGNILFGTQTISKMPTDEIARAGIMLAFQNPQIVPGVSLTNLLTIALRKREQKGKQTKLIEFTERIKETAKKMRFPEEFLSRSLNEGFSGGEKKKSEMLQLAILPAKCVIFDEIDSGLDVDALKLVAKQISALRAKNVSVIIITHYHRLLRYIKPDKVHVMHTGRIVRSGGPELAKEIEDKGYSFITGEKE
ncbi:MAG: Fe-S cluster assembly ATP-binding protein SufC [Parcubacteria group bacterium GW2011_GWA2_49_9]|nr:MAG: Fe-S cluster assembly ATP-binding protein SufC [Parcubacteria group bacterium GW2011_GWA2_49_9]